jgi:hypothetical protein
VAKRYLYEHSPTRTYVNFNKVSLVCLRNPLHVWSALQYVYTTVTFLLSHYFSTTPRHEHLTTVSRFFSVTSLGTVFLFNLTVPTQSVESSMFSCLANSGLPHKVFIYSIRTRPNSGSKSFSTLSTVLGFSGIMKLDYGTLHHSNSYRKLCSKLKRYTFLTVAFFLSAEDTPLMVTEECDFFSPTKFNS